ncbi:glyoxylate/hydroxypyruvate reductase A [Bradyrhizobium sp. CCGUVB23]|uniref:2-hydroxyacid dehydrogenase n=1 Tax=Bradyrhizobium sp. CCGUVB23 TaxID=2949630 RepID=UPI0020B40621|nr:glyoxylate/hydroxypyruvate reductase A [Bradyrhizobium sp. CCGUVB23]MCP3465473.1 glyoxylate/hydroxypyruvate reductase A [Bradyrhizobium sp. CCGUVB23]
MRCVLVSKRLDLRRYYGAELARTAPHLEVVDHAAGAPANDVRVALAWHPPDDAFERYPNLQAVCSIAAGVDNIIACPSLKPGIDVVRVVDPGQAQLMFGFVAWHVIGHQRGFAGFRAQQRDRVWQRRDQRRAQEVPVGVLGSGAIGQRVAQDLAFLGFPVMSWSRSAKPVPSGVRGFDGPAGLSAMLDETEVLVNLLPLTSETRGLLNGTLFGKMRRGGYLIQVGRGEHLVEPDLLAALDSGKLSGAALDVFATEPLPHSHPFWDHPKIAITPHDASDVSISAVVTTLAATADAICAGRRPPHAIDRARGY